MEDRDKKKVKVCNEDRIFFDAHMHAFNLSHPNFGAFVLRLFNGKTMFKITFYILIFFGLIWTLSIYSAHLLVSGVLIIFLLIIGLILIVLKLRGVIKLLNLMDMKTSQYLFTIEKEYMRFWESGGSFNIGGNEYDKIALCPLLMHFRSDHRMTNMWKPLKYLFGINYAMAQKSIQEQTVDLFVGIREYYKESPCSFMKIYPFMGIMVNDQHYNKKHPLKDVLDKYFGIFSIENRQENLDKKYSDFTGDIEMLKEYTFAGVKLYPPLGFNPWPDDISKRGDLELLYGTCEKKRIPIIIHCGGHGFKTVTNKEFKVFGNPEQWKHILANYPDLKICFAHFGPGINSRFIKKHAQVIVDLITDHNYKNVYTDISCRCFKNSDFRKLKKMIKREAKRKDIDENILYDKILYGTDFPMNQLKSGSYGNYIDAFSKCKMTDIRKKALSSDNPKRFLFDQESNLPSKKT